MKLKFISLAISALFLAACASPPASQATVTSLDLNRYAGEWHEIARLPNRFEKDLVAAKATYTRQINGDLNILNEGLKADGSKTSIQGTARQPRPSDPGKLLVRFDQFPASLFQGDYWILSIDGFYTRVLVGSPDMDYLWLLSKQPAASRENFSEEISRAKSIGYATEDLYFNPRRISN